MVSYSASFLKISGLRLSRLAVGCSHFGTDVDRQEVRRIVSAALDTGVTLFDTADIYSKGESELALGQALSGRRHAAVIATKFGHDAVAQGASQGAIYLALDNSLRRIKTDYIDLYQLHAPDSATPVEETLSTLQELVKAGKILSYGICNVKLPELANFCRIARAQEGSALTTVQNPFNLLNYEHYETLRSSLKEFHVGLLASLPLARGLLGGRYRSVANVPAGHPLAGYKGLGYRNARTIALITRLLLAAEQLNRSPAQLALETILASDDTVSALVGVRSTSQLLSLVNINPTAMRQETTNYILGQRSSLY